MMQIAKTGAKPRRGAGEMFPVIEKYLASKLAQQTAQSGRSRRDATARAGDTHFVSL